MKDYQIIDKFTNAVIKCGGRIVIDDFENGFSNLVHLFKIQADYIKIDGEIIKSICDDAYACELMEIIAKFVENKNPETLKNAGIKYSQGYYYSKPEKKI